MKKYDLKNIDREELADLLEQEMREAGLEGIDDGLELEYVDEDECALVPNSEGTAVASLNERETPGAARALGHSIRTSDEVSGDTVKIDIVDSRGRRVRIALCWDGESEGWRHSTQEADNARQSPEKEPSP